MIIQIKIKYICETVHRKNLHLQDLIRCLRVFKIKCKNSFELHVLTLNFEFNDCLKCLAQIYVVWYFGIYLQILLNSVRHKSKWLSFSYRVIIIDNLIIKSLLQEWLIAQVYLWAWELSGTKTRLFILLK